MKNHQLYKLLFVICLNVHLVITDECLESNDNSLEECVETEYESYITCVRKRVKRNANCGSAIVDSCESCNCNYCSSHSCDNHCNSCCANFQQPCETKYCCYKTCHSQCNNHGCRDTCRKSCTERLTEKESSPLVSTPNITTIINLHNKINNTNIIDVPINLKTDNINNITINTGDYGSNGTTSSNPQCCQVVSPRQCTPTTQYPFMKCFHLRKRTCGSICKADIMHAQPHQICDQIPNGPTDCHNQVIYIPQPQPRCTYKADWPYVSCGIPPANCDGCYDHYFNNGQRPETCPNNCYGQGYNVGPYNRPGPMYQTGLPQTPYTQPFYNGYGYPMGALPSPMYGAPQSPLPIPYSGVGYAPATYDNYYSVQTNPEVPELSKLLSNFTQNDDYYAQTLPINITNSMTQQASKPIDPTLVKIEAINATNVLMTIKEMNQEPSLGESDKSKVPTGLENLRYDPVTGQYTNGSHFLLQSDVQNLDPVTLGIQGTDPLRPVVRSERTENEVTKGESKEKETKIKDTKSTEKEIKTKENTTAKTNHGTSDELRKETLLNQKKDNVTSPLSSIVPFQAFPLVDPNNTTRIDESSKTTKSSKEQK